MRSGLPAICGLVWNVVRPVESPEARQLSTRTLVQDEESWWNPWRELDGVFVLHVDLTPDFQRESHAVSMLDALEKDRYHRLVSVRARREFALCRAALRATLARRLGCAHRQLSFGYLEHGKPYAKVAGRSVHRAFNVSHSGMHGLIAISGQNCVGVDVEERAPRRDLDGIGSFVFSPEERQLLRIATGREKVQLFYRLWSMKEALIKALGTGFSLSPSEFEIPSPVLQGGRSCVFRFPHLPSVAWKLQDLGELRFAAAYACRMSPPPEANSVRTRNRRVPPETPSSQNTAIGSIRDGHLGRDKLFPTRCLVPARS